MARLAALALLVWLAAVPVWAQPAADRRPYRVLGLYSDDRLLPAVQQLEAGFRAALSAETAFRVEYFAEFLDTVRFDTGRDRRAMLELLRDRYRDRPPDAIVAVSRPALQFLLDYRSTLFPSVPIVHVAIASQDVAAANLNGNVTGLASSDPADALGLALRLQPDTRQVVVVSGTSDSDRSRRRRVETEADRLKGRIAFTWLTSHTLEEVQHAVRLLPAHTVVLFVSFFEDSKGRVWVSREALERLSPVSNAPVYGNFESFVGYGIVGGTMETWDDTGRQAAEVVLRILRGTPIKDATAGISLPVRTIVDWRQVERFGLQRADFPPGTEFRFRPPSLWDAYRTQVLVAMAVGALQLGLIAALAVTLQRRRASEATRREAEARAAGLRHELAHASRVTLLGELASTLAHEINQPLTAILSNAQATRRWLNTEQPDLDEIRVIVDDIIADDKRAGEIIHRMRALLKKGDQELKRFDLGAAVRNVATLLHGELLTARVTLDLRLPETPVVVEGDEIATQQVLLNLILNGIQSIQDAGSPARRVSVDVNRVADGVRVTVHDTGRGVSDDARERLFEPFFSTRSRGLGVGLSICRRIVEAQGGTLDLGASPSGGATFVLDLPTVTRAA